jgi:hypothetical protein
MSQNYAPVNVSITPQGLTSGAGRENEPKGGSLADSNTEMRAMVLAMQQAMLQMQQRMEEMSQASGRRSISDTLHPAQGERAGEYSASASIQRPPVVAAQYRVTDARRQSMGVPSYPFTPGTVTTPAPPQPQRRVSRAVRMASLDEGAEDDNDRHDTAATETRNVDDDGMPQYDERLARVRKSITSIIKPFHGQTELDKYNVLDWVEKVDTEFSIQMRTRQAGRLDIVRSLLAGSALKWMNRKLLELNEKAARGELSEDIEWEAMRKPFIDAHLGINTIETFKSQLRALRLGSTKCPTPVELNQEFDHLAGLAYPDRRSEMRESVLGDEYGKIVAASNLTIYKSVAYNQNPSNIDDWKLHVSRRWAAGKNVEAVEAQLKGRGGGRGGWAGSSWPNKAGATGNASAAAMAATEGAGSEGEPHTEEGQNDAQLNAVASNSQRGGRRGGRGGGGAGQSTRYSPELIKKLAEEKKCFNCGQGGHISRGCVNTRVDLSKE